MHLHTYLVVPAQQVLGEEDEADAVLGLVDEIEGGVPEVHAARHAARVAVQRLQREEETAEGDETAEPHFGQRRLNEALHATPVRHRKRGPDVRRAPHGCHVARSVVTVVVVVDAAKCGSVGWWWWW